MAPSENIIMRAPAPSLAFFRADNFCISRGGRAHHHFPLFVSCLAPAVQPDYLRAPGHGPGTNLRKALEEWNAVCYLAGGPFGSLNWAQREKLCDCHAFLGRLGVCKLTLFRLRSAGIADRKVPWLSCLGSIILRRARGESRGGRRRGMGAAFFCVMKSSCSRGVEGRLPGLGFNRLPCGNCL